jgi:hypothetical protein
MNEHTKEKHGNKENYVETVSEIEQESEFSSLPRGTP